MSLIELYTTLLLGYLIACWYGASFVLTLIKRWICNPSDRFWEVKQRDVPPACLSDSALGNHAYIQIKNVKLHYVEKGDRTKPLMLCLHGFPEFWYSWRYQLREFSSDYWVVAVDMRGCGDSDKPEAKCNYTIDCLLADVKNLITALGKEKCTLVAHDWGGVVAWFLLLQEPQMIDSYVIMNSVHPLVFMNVIKNNWEQFKMSWYIFFHQLPYLPELMYRMDDFAIIVKVLKPKNSTTSTVNDEDLEAFIYTLGKPGALKFPIDYYRANFLLLPSRKLKDLHHDDFPPGLLIMGEDDQFIHRKVQEESVKLVKNAKLVYIPGANHFVQQDDPKSVNNEMRKFFSEKCKTQ